MTDAGKNDTGSAYHGSRRGTLLGFLLLISLATLHRVTYTMQSNYQSFSGDISSSSVVVPLVVNYSTLIATEATRATNNAISSQSLPIYLIDASDINHTTVAASTWGKIAPNWNQTAQYSNIFNVATSVPSLPKQNGDNISSKNRQIILIHCGPKLGSTTLRKACRRYIDKTCPQINFKTYMNGRERRSRAPAGYFGGDRLVSIMNECVDTHYFCVNQIQAGDMFPSQPMLSNMNNESEMAAMNTYVGQNVEYIHLFPFRNYNDWVKSAIKQQYDRGGERACLNVQRLWDGDRCKHSSMETDLRKYSRVDLDRFQDGIVRRMNDLQNGHEDTKWGEVHTFILYMHRDLQRVIEIVSAAYNKPMLPGMGKALKGTRPEGTCNETLVDLYHACFDDEMMNFRWDLPENQVNKNV